MNRPRLCRRPCPNRLPIRPRNGDGGCRWVSSLPSALPGRLFGSCAAPTHRRRHRRVHPHRLQTRPATRRQGLRLQRHRRCRPLPASPHLPNRRPPGRLSGPRCKRLCLPPGKRRRQCRLPANRWSNSRRHRPRRRRQRSLSRRPNRRLPPGQPNRRPHLSRHHPARRQPPKPSAQR